MLKFNFLTAFCALAMVCAASPASVLAQSDMVGPGRGAATYADLMDLADSAGLVMRGEIRKQARLAPERAAGLQPGFARLYIELRTSSLLAGNAPVGESVRYLVDVPTDSRGRVPKLKKQEVLLFARAVPGRPGEIQLVEPTAQLAWNAGLEREVRSALSQLVAPDAPPAITGIREALSIEGNLAGESETQVFLSTRDSGPVSLSVIRRPDLAPVWGVSWTEIVDQAVQPPGEGTLEWYRLACFLPDRLPAEAQISGDSASRQRADRDYRYVLDQLGPCLRNR